MRVIEPTTHVFGSNGAEDDNVAERGDRGREGEERRRGGMTANAKRGIGARSRNRSEAVGECRRLGYKCANEAKDKDCKEVKWRSMLDHPEE